MIDDPQSDRARALTLTPVSRETEARLDRFVALLLERRTRLNLIAPSTVPQLWVRHVADSLQLVALAEGARAWVDAGSGAGFPGLVIACALADQPGTQVHLVESVGKKVAFLREAVAAARVPAVVRHERMEKFVETCRDGVDVVTARAVSPLSSLLEMCFPLVRRGALGLFPKGQDVEAELTEASKYWKITADLVPSRTDSRGRIVRVRGLERRAKAP
jgi:16S rRNA (guanine527-N7)-methyltransferase